MFVCPASDRPPPLGASAQEWVPGVSCLAVETNLPAHYFCFLLSTLFEPKPMRNSRANIPGTNSFVRREKAYRAEFRLITLTWQL